MGPSQRCAGYGSHAIVIVKASRAPEAVLSPANQNIENNPMHSSLAAEGQRDFAKTI
jgi:hypothetical protein